MSQRFGGRTMARAAVLVTGSTYVAYAAGLLASTLVARALGPADYGRYAYVLWLSGLLVMVMNNGLTTTVIRFVSELLGRGAPVQARSLGRRLARWQAASVLLAGLGLMAVLPWLRPTGWSEDLALFAAIVLAAAVGKAAYLFGVSVAKGHGRFDLEAMSVTLLALANVLGVVGLALLGRGLVDMLLLFVLVSLAHPPLLWWLQRRRPGSADEAAAPDAGAPVQAESESALMARVRLHFGWTVALTLVAALSNKAIETFLLNRHAGAETVAYFSIAVALTRGGVDLLSSGLNSILMPLMAHGYGQGGTQRAGRITADAVRLFHFLGLLLAGVGVLWAPPMVLLMYGQSYQPAVLALQVMVVVGGFTLSTGAFGALLSISDHQKARTAVVALSIAVSGVVALLLVPRWGLGGALVSHLVSTLVVFGLTAAVVVRTMGVRLHLLRLVRLTLAALLAGAAAALLLALDRGHGMHLLAGVLYALLMLLLSVRLRAWHADDAALLEGLAARLPPVRHFSRFIVRWSA